MCLGNVKISRLILGKRQPGPKEHVGGEVTGTAEFNTFIPLLHKPGHSEPREGLLSSPLLLQGSQSSSECYSISTSAGSWSNGQSLCVGTFIKHKLWNKKSEILKRVLDFKHRNKPTAVGKSACVFD